MTTATPADRPGSRPADRTEPTEPTRNGVLETLGALVDLAASGDEAWADLRVSPALHQPYGIVHGGVYAALAERVAEAGAQAWLGTRGRARTTVVGTQFLRAVREGTVRAVASPVHRGRGQQLWQVRMTEQDPTGGTRVVAVSEVRVVNRAD